MEKSPNSTIAAPALAEFQGTPDWLSVPVAPFPAELNQLPSAGELHHIPAFLGGQRQINYK